MVGIDDVARAAQVSTATVSRTLSGRGPVSAAARERVLEAASSLGYVVSASASGLASGRTRSIGVLMPLLDRWFFATVLHGISTRLQAAGYDLTLYHLSSDEPQRSEVFETALRRRRIDGVLTVSVELGDDEIAQLQAIGLPVLAIGSADPRLARLTVDEAALATAATRHLLDLGHRRIAHLGVSDTRRSDIPAQRAAGFAREMARAGLSPARLADADFTTADGYRATATLLKAADRPTAIFAASDEMAVGALLAARDRGLSVPDDLSIVGVDGHELSAFLGLTTVDQFPLAQGQRAAEAMLATLENGERPPASVDLPFELVVRGSTAPPAAEESRP
jgi:LacI family repressor for deo operon, udp, cdd, tsx, nupC, and nupG